MFAEKLTRLFRNMRRTQPKYICATVAPGGLIADRQLPPEHVPAHVAIIMDGNGRWAQKRGLPRSSGHAAGTEALRDIIRASDDWGIKALSIYAFSTENWARSREEVNALMGLLLKYFKSEIDELDEKNVCIRILGDVDGLPDAQREAVRRALTSPLCVITGGPGTGKTTSVREIDELDEKHVRIRILGDVEGLPEAQRDAVKSAMERTKDNTGLKLNIALNYGGHAELTRATKLIAQDVADGKITVDQITDQTIEDHLYTAGIPNVDLLIRTSGEMRTSNFLPWQLAYAEMIFDSVYWPDFDRAHYLNDLRIYASRNRRFGGGQEEQPEVKL